MAMPGSRLCSTLYGAVALAVFGLLLFVASVLALIVPGLNLRRRLIRTLARIGLMVLGLRISVRGADHLPQSSCIVVANHCSYLDGVLLKAVLPPRFSFVIKREAAAYPVAGLLLRRIGSEFVDRGSLGGRQSDARRVVRRAEAGHSLVFFPEGTFTAEPGLRRFHVGAFVAAAHARQMLVPVVIRGTRRSMPSGAIVPRAGRLEVEILEPILPGPERGAAEALRREARRRMVARLDEPDLETGLSSVPAVSGAAGRSR
jgi:1-acyl-sn-glycerol-3-phosphate acyltransferase